MVSILSLQMSSSSEFNIDLSTHMEADLPKKSVLTVVAHSGDLYNYQPGTQDLLTSNNSEMGISCRILEEELLSIQNCTRYIRDPAITIKICLLSINIPRLQPFSSLTT